jgi:hypothetical protein
MHPDYKTVDKMLKSVYAGPMLNKALPILQATDATSGVRVCLFPFIAAVRTSRFIPASASHLPNRVN